jgi:hypothetical protein
VRNSALESDAQASLSNSLSLIASDTGGRFFGNFVNFKEPLQMINEDNNGYFLLSYEAEVPSGEVGYREVEVQLDNPDFLVRARKGYRFGDG